MPVWSAGLPVKTSRVHLCMHISVACLVMAVGTSTGVGDPAVVVLCGTISYPLRGFLLIASGQSTIPHVVVVESIEVLHSSPTPTDAAVVGGGLWIDSAHTHQARECEAYSPLW